MSHWNHPQLPFLDDTVIIEKRHKFVSPYDKKTWRGRKASVGLIRNDITGGLLKTDSGFPIVKAYHGDFPTSIIGLNKLNTICDRSVWLHGFSEDFVLERIWNRPQKYIERIRHIGGVFSPDFSMYLNMSPIEKEMNVFRKNAISQIFQNKGLNVIYTLCWAEYDSLEYCIEGVEAYGIYAVSNIGVNNNYISRKFFRVGIKELIRRLAPEGLIVYGYPLDFRLDCEFCVFHNENLERLHRLRK